MFSKKATKFEKIFDGDLTHTTYCQINSEDFVNFWGLLRKHGLDKRKGVGGPKVHNVGNVRGVGAMPGGQKKREILVNMCL